MKISNELKIGFWAIVTCVVLFLGVNYLKGVHTLRQGDFYYLLSEKVEGLAISSHVKLHGLKVGIVREMQYDKKSDKVLVTLNIYNDEIQIPVDSRVTVTTDLLGTSSINLELGGSDQYFNPWDTIKAPATNASLLDKADPIIAKVDALLPKLDTLVSGITVLVNESKVQESLLELNKMTVRLNQTVNSLNGLLKNDVPTIMNNVESTTANLDTISSQLKEAEVEKILANANRTLNEMNQLMKRVQANDNTVGKLLNTTELHEHLNNTLSDVDSLVNAIKENPKKYIRVKVF
ncbi:MAG: MCE family protein [Bacteroidales bacterium]|nr:MCE family protein [Bacteroidales bacterium]